MTIEQLRERLAYWQRVLRLQDWEIAVRIIPQHHICESAPTCTGRNRFNHVYRTSLILVADPSTVCMSHEAAFAGRPYDLEQVLVHELVHLLMPHVQESTDDAEFSIEMVANALLRLEQRTVVVTVDGHAIDIRCRGEDSLCTRIELDPTHLAQALARHLPDAIRRSA